MKLYAFPVAPNPTKVRIYLLEKGIEMEIVRVDLREGAQRRPEFLARNPLGKLPVLELDDGSALTESLAIIEYLEELHPEPPMIGSDPLERARVRERERLCDLGVLLSTARWVHATRSPLGLPPRPELAQLAAEQREASLRVLEEGIGSAAFVAGGRISVADCTLFAGLQFGAVFGMELDARFERLTAWQERFRERPSTQW